MLIIKGKRRINIKIEIRVIPTKEQLIPRRDH